MTHKHWTTREGDEIAVKDMETSHIENCIKFMQKKLDTGNTIQVIGDPPMWDGEDAGAWADEIDMTDEIKDWIKTFKRELNKRK